ncbi:hypothetical protein LH128_00422 [Sphingomonas sp. LH128]|uniref:lasso peptide biosynthesis B2 protein n=1 Tax=Sphingomonas sp. LH128 TaxID=473781 RepID=UPI00027CB4C0|nr:lasso peptide biosynthesis B2 protein [Sphingomonas sp. LH128]EJU15100.1 hypothetical protein LH128_00422 [Sphingomonas sp. LH128]
MPFIAPRTGVGLCDYEDRFLALDIDRDRYFELKPELTELVRRWLEGFELTFSQTEALTKSGLFGVSQTAGLRHDHDRRLAERAIVGTEAPVEIGVRFVLDYARALVWLAFFHWSMRRRSLRFLLKIANARAQYRAQGTARIPRTFPPGLMICLSAFSRASLLFPRTSRCLPDALALQRLASRHTAYSKIVFGVQADPFQAHCWVQLDKVVLGQGLDVVAGFRPILTSP